MNRFCYFLTPPLAFALAAWLAWSTRAPVESTVVSENIRFRSSRQRDAVAVDSGDLTVALSRFENQVSRDPIKPKQIHDAEGMDRWIVSDAGSANFCGGGMASIEYSFGWADEAPEEMLAWLIQQNGYSYQRALSPASILFGSWAKKDMAAALAAVPKIPNPDLRRQALASTLEVLCTSDPARARELLLQNLSLFLADGGRSSFKPFNTSQTTCDMLLTLPPGEARTHLLAGLLTSMADWSLDGVSQYAISHWKKASGAERREWVAAGFSSGKDNATSFDGLETLMRQRAEITGDPAVAQSFVTIQGEAWAKRDLPGAFNWTQAHLKGKCRVEEGVKLFGYAASQDFDTAIGTWKNLPDGILKARAAGEIAKNSPPARKAEAEAIIESLSKHDKNLAR
jgi:hypothetical protein